MGSAELHPTECAYRPIAVESTGADIDAKTLPRLFNRFYRADASRAHPDSDGSGLGVPITRAIAEAHAGQVTATSGQGANLLRSGVSASRCQAPKLTTMSSGCLGSVG